MNIYTHIYIDIYMCKYICTYLHLPEQTHTTACPAGVGCFTVSSLSKHVAQTQSSWNPPTTNHTY